jgi:hypothetical protein
MRLSAQPTLALLIGPMFNWFHRRAEYRALIEADAKALIEKFGEQAYAEARERQHFPPLDGETAMRQHLREEQQLLVE